MLFFRLIVKSAGNYAGAGTRLAAKNRLSVAARPNLFGLIFNLPFSQHIP